MSDTFVQNESIETLIHRYKSTIYGVALSYTSNRADADDIFQEVFLIYYKVNPRFNRRGASKSMAYPNND